MKVDNPSSNDKWMLIEDLQAMLAHAQRRHEGGDTISVQEVLGQAEILLSKAIHEDAFQVVDTSVRDLLIGYWEQVATRNDCTPTGFKKLNDALGGGLEAKRLVVLLGPPGIGKTAFVNQIADHAANGGYPVLYVTSEDMPFTLLAKTLARIGDVNYTAVLKGWETERSRINAAIAMQKERQSTDLLHYVDASQGLPVKTMKDLARAHFTRHADAAHRGILVLDYLQRFARAQRVSQSISLELRELVTFLTEQLRSMACELDCCVIALASQNRASGYGARNTNALASAKESGDIEYTADVIIAISREDESNPGTRKSLNSFTKPAVLRIDKNRQGPTVERLELVWQGDRQRFIEVAK